MIALAISCGVLIFWWAREACGDAAAVVSSSLWLLDPNVLAFSAAATVDIGAAAFGCLAAYTYWWFLRGPSWTKAVICGTTLGLAQASKFSMLVLYPAWLVLAPATWRAAPPTGGRFAAKIALIFLTSLIALNMVYQFTGSFRPLGSFSFRSELLSSNKTTDADVILFGNRFRGTIAADFPVPLPRDYVLGLDSQKWEEEIGLKSLRNGHLVRGGRWYSPLVTSAFKLPLGTLVLIAASAIYVVLSGFKLGLADAVAWVSFLSFVGLLCSQTGCNWAIRYMLPAFPFLFLAVGRPAQVAWSRAPGAGL